LNIFQIQLTERKDYQNKKASITEAFFIGGWGATTPLFLKKYQTVPIMMLVQVSLRILLYSIGTLVPVIHQGHL